MNACVFWMAVNFLSSVGIVWANKMVFNTGFACPTSLTILHFVSTFLGLAVCARIGLFQVKKIPLVSVVPISTVFAGFVLFNNLSLKLNAVGTYQLLKVLTTPTIVAIQFFFYRTSLSKSKILSLVPICLGVVLATVSSVEINARGIFFGLAGIVSTSIYQVWVKTEQTRFLVTSQQLLLLQSPLSAFLLLPFAECELPPVASWVWISISSTLAFLVNLSIFLIIGNTSPLTYNVLGHAKLCVILVSGYTLFGEQCTILNLSGVLLALGGVVSILMISDETVRISLWMVINFVSSVWIIWAMKICFQEGFHFATSLTALHFLLTYIGLEISACLEIFERKHVPLAGVLPLSIAFCAFIVFNNISLEYNTIGIYQITKVLTTPAIVLIHMIFYKRYLALNEAIALCLVCAGVMTATQASLDLNSAGLGSAFLGVMSSSVYQIWVETKQVDLNCSPAQLLYYQAPISFLLLLPVIYFTEPVNQIISYNFTSASIFAIFGSAILAFLVNLSAFAVIGATSPVTYNMVGHSKLVIIIMSSYLFFGERQTILGLAGIVAAVIGIVAYAHVRMAAQRDASKKKSEEELFQLAEKLPLVRLPSDDSWSTTDV